MKINLTSTPQDITNTKKVISSDLQKDVYTKIKPLSNINQWQSVLAIFADWAMILACIWLSVKTDNLFIYLISLIFIAGRQHGLFVLTHDGTHYLLFKNRFLNDLISEAFTSYPIFVTTELYRINHFLHHRYLNTDQDPDFVRKNGLSEWRFPMKKPKLVQLALSFLRGYGAKQMYLTAFALTGIRFPKVYLKDRGVIRPLLQIIYYICMTILIIRLHVLKIFILYWLVPYFCILPIFMHIRSVAEHFGLPATHDINSSRNVTCSLIEKFTVAPHNVSYHLVHHLYPFIPFYSLERANKIMHTVSEYHDNAHENSSYFGIEKSALIQDLIEKKATTE